MAVKKGQQRPLNGKETSNIDGNVREESWRAVVIQQRRFRRRERRVAVGDVDGERSQQKRHGRRIGGWRLGQDKWCTTSGKRDTEVALFNWSCWPELKVQASERQW